MFIATGFARVCGRCKRSLCPVEQRYADNGIQRVSCRRDGACVRRIVVKEVRRSGPGKRISCLRCDVGSSVQLESMAQCLSGFCGSPARAHWKILESGDVAR
jgi:hypothetical protein